MDNSASAFSFADVPGFVEASSNEARIRSLVCLGINETICGCEVKPLNANHIALLSLINYPFHGGYTLSQLAGTRENSFLDGKPGILGDIINFLWIVSPMYQAGVVERKSKWRKRTARDRFNRAFRSIMWQPIDKVVKEILEYVQESYIDCDDSRSSAQKTGWSFQIAIAAELHQNYGYRIDFWSPDCPADKNPLFVPLKIITQLRKHRAWLAGAEIKNKSDKALDEAMSRLRN